MPHALSHVVMFTDDLDAVVRFLVDHANVGPVVPFDNGEPAHTAELFGWPIEHSQTRGVLVGSGPGTLDIVEIPTALRGQIKPGVRLLGLPQRNSPATGVAAAAAGYQTHGPVHAETAAGRPVTIVEVTAGGLPFELIQFRLEQPDKVRRARHIWRDWDAGNGLRR